MSDVKHYHEDGANKQAQAVLAMFQYYLGDGVEASWSEKFSRYEAEIRVARWENCREQGYVLYMKSPDYKKQLNIAFYEHRNCDTVYMSIWEQRTFNAPTLDTPDTEGEQNSTYGWENSHAIGYNKIAETAEYMFELFEKFWTEHKKEVDSKD